ncbi:MAG: hypothetical protein AAF484_13565 [Pseudomonadota bacterium]
MRFSFKAIRKASGLALCAVCIATGLATGSAVLAQQDDMTELRTLRHLSSLSDALARLSPAPKLEDMLRDIYFRADVDGSGAITFADALILQQLDHATQRKDLIAYWARHDLNNDGMVTSAEIRQTYLPEARGSLMAAEAASSGADTDEIEARLAELLENRGARLFDADADGTYTFEDVLSEAEARFPASPDGIAALKAGSGKRWTEPTLVLPGFDADRDGTVTEQEFLGPYMALLAKFDTDGDGVLSDDERTALREQSKAALKTLSGSPAPSWFD